MAATSTPTKDPSRPLSVGDPTKEWEADEKKHTLARALREGRDAMVRHAKQYVFMKPNPGENQIVSVEGSMGRDITPPAGDTVSVTATSGKATYTLFELRLERADLPNPWADSILDLARTPFAEQIVLEGWDDEVQGKDITDSSGRKIRREPGMVDDIDGEGRSLDHYAADAFEDCLFEGIVFSLVDNDSRKFNTAADRREAKARPYTTMFKRAEVPIILYLSVDGGPKRLVQVTLVQPIREIDWSDPNARQDVEIDARKVITAAANVPASESDLASFLAGGDVKPMRFVTTRVYVKAEKGWEEDLDRRGVIRPDDPQDELLEIPLAPHYSKRTGAYRGECPFLNTAWSQNAIWNQNSELSGLAREAALTRVHISGYDPTVNVATPNQRDTVNSRFTYSKEASSRMQIGEFAGTAGEFIMNLIKYKSDGIRKAHHRMASDKPRQPVTAREITLEAVQASSALEMWIIFQESAWEKILGWMALLGGYKKRGSACIPHDFGLPSASVERNQSLYETDHMFAGNYFAEAKRAGDVDDAFDVEVEIRLQAMRIAADLGVGERVASGEVEILDSIVAMLKGEKMPERAALEDYDEDELDLEDDDLAEDEDV